MKIGKDEFVNDDRIGIMFSGEELDILQYALELMIDAGEDACEEDEYERVNLDMIYDLYERVGGEIDFFQFDEEGYRIDEEGNRIIPTDDVGSD